MLVMKAWLETRWRLTAVFAYLLICLAVNYQSHNSPAANPRGMLIALGAILVYGSLTLAGSGVKSQSPAGFPEGLAGSTQFTLSLPVSRRWLFTVRTAIGMLETVALTLFVGCLILTTVLFLAAPYCAAVFFVTLLDEPLSMVFAGWTITLLLWLLHRTAPAVDMRCPHRKSQRLEDGKKHAKRCLACANWRK